MGNDKEDYNFPEPFFEGEVLAELGYSFSKHLFRGDMESFRRDRGTFDGLPQLGLWATPLPWKDNLGHSNLQIAGGPANIPRETFHYPIPSTHFEKVSRDSFWDFAARRWGLEVVRPQQVAKFVTIDNPDLKDFWPEVHEATSIAEEMGIGSKFAFFRRTDFEFDKLFTLTLPEIQLHKQALDEYKRFGRLRRRKNFRGMRANMAKTIGDAKTNWKNTLGITDSYYRRYTQLYLLNAIIDEAEDHLREVVAYRQEDTPDERHVCFILILNRHLRELHKELKDNLIGISTDDEKQFPSLVRTENALDATFLMLTNNLDPTSKILLDRKKEAEDIQRIYDSKDLQNESAELRAVLKLGEQAITDDDGQLCGELGGFLSHCYEGTPTLRDIGMVILFHHQKGKRWRDFFLALTRLEDMSRGDEEDRRLREKWVGIARPLKEALELLPEPQRFIEEMRADCLKSSADDFLDDPSSYCKVQ